MTIRLRAHLDTATEGSEGRVLGDPSDEPHPRGRGAGSITIWRRNSRRRRRTSSCREQVRQATAGRSTREAPRRTRSMTRIGASSTGTLGDDIRLANTGLPRAGELSSQGVGHVLSSTGSLVVGSFL